MRVIGDLHIHSRFSRATSPKLTPSYLDRWARIKGIGLLGTGDCTHPKWLEILRDELDDAEAGFYVLKDEVRKSFDSGPALSEALPLPPEPAPVRFVLTGEISTIYKYGDKTRKVHHVVILPDFKAAAAFQVKLEQIGNIRSDGRPILGLDSRDLLSILLETDERSILIPAHIWTPWFSALGAKSGFDSIGECYRDLVRYIPAIETGLSSNPPMNWALESLDAFSIVSNSDAHSPDKLGREATIFEMDWSYDSFMNSFWVCDSPMRKKFPGVKQSRIMGTVEFFPQEGKYHYDGHRNCQVFLNPEEARERDCLCPVCGKPFTPGVMGRVLELADRGVDEKAACPENGGPNCTPYFSLIPLKEILGELLGTGPASKKVEAAYGRLINNTGSEFSILLDLPLEKIESIDSIGNLAEALRRMRNGEVVITPGYDGEYGVIRTFSSGESKHDGAALFDEINPAARMAVSEKRPKFTAGKIKALPKPESQLPVFAPDKTQRSIIESKARECLIIAGPGTGKTAVLAAKIYALMLEGAEPSSILALSFTVKAAGELRDRVHGLSCRDGRAANEPVPHDITPTVSTFHSLCASILREQYGPATLAPDFRIIGENERKEIFLKISGAKKTRGFGYIESRKRYLLLPGEKAIDLARILPSSLHSLIKAFVPEHIPQADDANEALYSKYRNILRGKGLVDYDGLIAGTVRLLALRSDILMHYQKKYRYIFVDEYQDINFAQYVLIRLLVSGDNPPSLWVIGDPNQAIYGFRGSDKAFIDSFANDYKGAQRFELRKSFRCAAPIIEAAGQLTHTSLEGVKVKDAEGSSSVSLFQQRYTTEKSEAEGIARTIDSLMGGASFFAVDSGAAGTGNGDLNLNECAILVRAAALAEPVIKAFKDHGIPYDVQDAMPWWESEPIKQFLIFLEENNSAGILEAWKIFALENGIASKSGKGIIPETVDQLVKLALLFGSVRALLDGLSAGREGIPGAGVSHGVKIMTIHASKGLEFDHVFVPALEEGILPFTLYDENQSIEEERRLLYVAMTRARCGLWLSGAASRFFRGRVLKAPASRFLPELGKMVPIVEEEKYRRDAQMNLF